jgi:hypothetical protein
MLEAQKQGDLIGVRLSARTTMSPSRPRPTLHTGGYRSSARRNHRSEQRAQWLDATQVEARHRTFHDRDARLLPKP